MERLPEKITRIIMKIVDIYDYESVWCCEELRKKFEYSIFKLGLSWMKRLLPSKFID